MAVLLPRSDCLFSVSCLIVKLGPPAGYQLSSVSHLITANVVSEEHWGTCGLRVSEGGLCGFAPLLTFSGPFSISFVVTCLLVESGGGKLVERTTSSAPISDALPAALLEMGSVDGDLAEDHAAARENLTVLLFQRKVGADMSGAVDSVGNAFVDLGAKDISVGNGDLNDELTSVQQTFSKKKRNKMNSLQDEDVDKWCWRDWSRERNGDDIEKQLRPVCLFHVGAKWTRCYRVMKILRCTSSFAVLKSANVSAWLMQTRFVWSSGEGVCWTRSPNLRQQPRLQGDISMAEHRIMRNVLSRFNDEWKKRMTVEDKLSINNCESLWASVQKVDLDL